MFLCRLCLSYGGADVTRTFFWLLQRAGFPYRECQLSNRLDCQLLQQLKELFCHLNQVCVCVCVCVCLNCGGGGIPNLLWGSGGIESWKRIGFELKGKFRELNMSKYYFIYSSFFIPQDISGLQDHEFRTRFPEAPALLYHIRLGDEKLQVL